MEIKVGESPEVNRLISKVKEYHHDMVPLGLAVELAVALTKDGVEKGLLTAKDAREFAHSLQDDCAVPVRVGNEIDRVVDVRYIVFSRPYFVASFAAESGEKGIDYDKMAGIRRDLATKTIERMKVEYWRQRSVYGQFTQYISFNGEMGKQAKIKELSKQILSGGDLPPVDENQDRLLNGLVDVSIPNIIWGEVLLDWLDNRHE